MYKIYENNIFKILTSENYNYFFNKINGYFARWGKNKEDDPKFSPFGPEICDFEVSTICSGVRTKTGERKLCPYCYKSCTQNGKNTSFETFKKVFDKITESKTLTQIAFGSDSQATSNPDLFKMMEYSREYGIIPNITVSDISDETADKIANVCGACAVSRGENKDICYDCVEKLINRGMNQVNIHCVIAQETFNWAMETLKDSIEDPRLSKLNAIVFLSLKQKGRGVSFNRLPAKEFKSLVDFATRNSISIGFDSCGAGKYLECIKDSENYNELSQYVESCESGIFSTYCNILGESFPCSFSEGEQDWEEGLNIINCDDFVKDIWNHPKTMEFRKKLLDSTQNNEHNCRECPLFKI